jgi:hypothetical protein
MDPAWRLYFPYPAERRNTGLASRHGSSLSCGRTRPVAGSVSVAQDSGHAGCGHGIATPHSSTHVPSRWSSQTHPSAHWPEVPGAMSAGLSAARSVAPSHSARGPAGERRPNGLSSPRSSPGADQFALEPTILALEVGHFVPSTSSMPPCSSIRRRITLVSSTLGGGHRQAFA